MEGGCGFAAHDCQTQTSYDPACAEQGSVHRRQNWIYLVQKAFVQC